MVNRIVWLDWHGSLYWMRVLVEPLAYQIGADEAGTDRFHRVYTITAQGDGRPKTCSCPRFTKRIDAQGTHPYCKHLQMTEKWWRENTEAGKEAQKLLKQQAVAAGL